MKKSGIISLLLMSMVTMAGFCETAPDTLVMTSTYNKLNLQCGQEYVIYDNGGPEGMYFGSGARYVTIQTEGTGTPIHISVRGNTASSDNVTIYRAASNEPQTLTTSDRMWYGGGALHWDGVSSTGEATVKFNVINTSTAYQYEGFEIRVWVSDSSEIYGVSNSQITTNSATITWFDTSAATSWVVKYGTSENLMTESVTTSQTTVTLTGLTPNMPYYCRIFNNATTNDSLAGYCMSNGTMFITRGDGEIPTGCVGDITDFTADYVICTYGHYSNPEENYGIVQGRHTAMTDSTASDPIVGDSLRIVPVGETYSVRLGNDNYNNEAESIIYRFRVDASESDMLLFKYAAVLQNPPSHSDDIQPRLQFQIMREDGTEIDDACYTAEFVANTDLGTLSGWHNHGTPAGSDGRILWHDWTSVGVDLEPLDGQVLYIKLTTKDCNEYATTNTGRHFGYAYFTLQCGNKDMEYGGCGASGNTTFTAPEGFEYFWHIQGQDDTLSTERTYVPQAGTTEVYECTMTFRGSRDNACSFTLTVDPAMANVYPHAAFAIDAEEECGGDVLFTNMSYVSSDAEGQDTLYDRYCNSYHWDFGDGSSSDEEAPFHVFPTVAMPQSYTVTLTARLSDSCESQFSQEVMVQDCPQPPVNFPDNVNAEPCTFPIDSTEWGLELETTLGSSASSPEGSVCNLITPLVGDLDDDGIPEIVCFGNKGGDVSGNPSSQLKRLLIYDGMTHQLKSYFDIGSGTTPGCFVSGFDAAPYGLVKLKDRTGLIVVACKDNRLRAFKMDGTLYWTTDNTFGTTVTNPANHPYATNVAFADFNNDSVPEVYVHGYIFNAESGVLLAQASSPNNNEGASYAHTYNNTGTSAWKLASSLAADIIGDERIELLLGNEIHSVDITNTSGTAGNSIVISQVAPLVPNVPSDGHAQVADFNLDGHLDIFITNRSNGNHTSTVYGYVWDVFNNAVSSPITIPVTKTGKSMPLIADIDNDDSLEVVIHCGVTGANVKAYKYHADSRTFTHFWDKSYNEDSFSNGVTMFDFNQDGESELLISDQTTLSIANGSREGFPPTNISTLNISEVTIMQYPVIADVDGDGAAEIVFVGGSKLNICRSAGDPWAPARPVWNQYMYNVTNVNKDLTIPTTMFNNAYVFTDQTAVARIERRPYNNFLQQATNIDTNGRPYRTAADLHPGPDYSVDRQGNSLHFEFDICNQGEAAFTCDTLYVTMYKDSYRGDLLETLENVGTEGTGLILHSDSCLHLDINLPYQNFCQNAPFDTIVIALNDRGGGIATTGLPQECDTSNNLLPVAFTFVPTQDTIYDTICQHQPYTRRPFNLPSDSTATPRLYVDSLMASTLCDTTFFLYLTIAPTETGDTSVTACTAYTWLGETYYQTGDYPHTLTTLQGCDSIVTLHLTILAPYEEFDTARFCEPFTWHGLSIVAPGDTTVTVSSPDMCDSIFHLHAIPGMDLVMGEDVAMTQQRDTIHVVFDVCNQGADPFQNDTIWFSFYKSTYQGEYICSLCGYNDDGSPIVITSDSCYHVDKYFINTFFCQFTPIDSVAITINDKRGGGVCHNGLPMECDTNNNTAVVGFDLQVTKDSVYDAVCQNTAYTEHGFDIPATATATPGILLDTLSGFGACGDTTILFLTVNQVYAVDTEATAIDSFLWYGNIYTQSGDYVHTTSTVSGCDSVVTLHLTILHLPEAYDTLSFCDSIVWRGYSFYNYGDTSVVVTDSSALDTIYHLHLISDADLTYSNMAITSFDDGVYIEFDIFNEGGVVFYADTIYVSLYADTYHPDSALLNIIIIDSSQPGRILTIEPQDSLPGDIFIPFQDWLCPYTPIDSLVVSINDFGMGVGQGGVPSECDTTNNVFKLPLHLTRSFDTIDTVVCQNRPYSDGLFNIPASRTAQPGLIFDSVTMTDPCGSMVFLRLTVLPNRSVFDTLSTCDSCQWHNQTYTVSGDYTYTGQTTAGCDSLMNLHLTINYSVSVTEEHTACDSFTWHGETYTESTNLPTFTYHTLANCDSVVRLLLTINNSDTLGTETHSACESYTWNEQTYRASGTYTFEGQTPEGCLFRQTLILTINHADTLGVETKSACDSYTWHGETYTVSGNYTYSTTTMAGCDSLVTLRLSIYPSYNEQITAAICEGGFFEFAGSRYTEAGNYPFTFTSIHNCDSLVTLQLTVNPVYDTIDRQVFCSSDPSKGYTWVDGIVYYVSTNTPRYTLQSISGCDSTLRLDLTIDRSMHAVIHYEPTRPTYDNSHVCLVDATNNSISRTWYLFDGTSYTDPQVCFDAPFDQDSISIVMVAASILGCFDTVRLSIPLDRSAIYVPNVFTPNLSQDFNNNFHIQGRQLLEVEVMVYTREGLLVATFDGLTESWNGTYHDQLCPQGTYAYHIRYRTASIPDEWQVLVGTVTLLR